MREERLKKFIMYFGCDCLIITLITCAGLFIVHVFALSTGALLLIMVGIWIIFALCAPTPFE